MNFVNAATPLWRKGLVAVIAAVVLAGCGGGGGASSGSTTVLPAAIQGTVLMPAVTAASRADDYEPVSSADVSLIDVETGDTVATTTTDADGDYQFTEGVEPNTDYKVEARAERDGESVVVTTIVTTDDQGKSAEDNDCDPVTTVASDAALDQWEAGRQADPDFKPGNLEDVRRELEEKARPNFGAGDQHSPEERERRKNELLQQLSPDGNYLGGFEGDSHGKIAAIIKDGTFAIIGLNDRELDKARDVTNFREGEGDGGGTVGGGDGGDGGDGAGTTGGDLGNGEGSGEGNGEGNGGGGSTVNPNDYGTELILGDIDGTGIVRAESADGHLKIQGFVLGDKGVGTWRSERDGEIETGVWRLRRATNPFAGLYAGLMSSSAHYAGIAYAMIGNEGQLFFRAESFEPTEQVKIGFGRVNPDGTFHFKYIIPGTQGVGSGAGQIHDGRVSLNLYNTDLGSVGEFNMYNTFDPSAAIQSMSK